MGYITHPLIRTSIDREWDNLAIPVQEPLSNEDFSPRLKGLFYYTKPTCYEYVQGYINTTGIWDNGPKQKNRRLEG